MKTWPVTKGYVVRPNYTKLLHTISEFANSYAELLGHRSFFGVHADHKVYMESGPLRECKTAHILKNGLISNFPNTTLLLNMLTQLVDISHTRRLSRAYITILEPGKQIYPHCDTDGEYWSTIDRYQFYFTGDSDMVQIINNTVFPIAPGYLYHFDHTQIHEYHNNSKQDLMLMVFDLQDKNANI